MFDTFFKFCKEVGAWGAIGIILVIVGALLSTGTSIDEAFKHFPPEHLDRFQGFGLIVTAIGLLVVLAQFMSKKETRAQATLDRANWDKLIKIVEGHNAISPDDSPVFPNRVTQSIYKFKSELGAFLLTVSNDTIASSAATTMRKMSMEFCTSVEEVEFESKMNLNSAVDVSLDKLTHNLQARFVRTHDRFRRDVNIFIEGVCAGVGEKPKEDILHQFVISGQAPRYS